MSNLRTGTYGDYYGSLYNESAFLTAAQMAVNAQYIYSYLIDHGWTAEAIAGVLGNMESESTLNPGIWQSNKIGNLSGGYGLVQWTAGSRHINWCYQRGLDPSEMDSNLAHLVWEINDGDDYYSTAAYPLSYPEFVKSTEAPYYLACAFAWNYERSWTVLYGTEAEKEALRKRRGGDAEKWYKYITGEDPTPPSGGGSEGGGSEGGGTGGGSSTIARKTSGFKFVLFGRKRRM